jgi:hypothetical protein
MSFLVTNGTILVLLISCRAYYLTSSLSDPPKSAMLQNSDLKDGQKILMLQEGKFWPARLNSTQLPDVYSVIMEKQRGNRPIILPRDDILKEAVSTEWSSVPNDIILNVCLLCLDLGGRSRSQGYAAKRHPGVRVLEPGVQLPLSRHS